MRTLIHRLLHGHDPLPVAFGLDGEPRTCLRCLIEAYRADSGRRIGGGGW